MKGLKQRAIKYRTFFEPVIYSTFLASVYLCFFWESFWTEANPSVARNLILLMAGIIGWYFLHRRMEAIEQSTQTAKQGLTVERLTRAIEQLDSEKISIRLVGIRSLEQIAETHEEERTKIIQILAARIREIAPPGPARKTEERHKHLDIEVAVEALANIAAPLSINKYLFCELQETNLSGLRFYGTDLSYFVLTDVDFSNTYFSGVDFEGAFFNGVNISGIEFEEFYGLDQEQIDKAFCWEGEQPYFLPDDFNPPPSKKKPQESDTSPH